MTKCGKCGHNTKAYFRPEDRKFIEQAALPWQDPDRDFFDILVRFVGEFERLQQKIEKGDGSFAIISAYNRYHDVLSHIRYNPEEDD